MFSSPSHAPSRATSRGARNMPRIDDRRVLQRLQSLAQPGPTSAVPTARTLSRRPCSACSSAEPARGMSWLIRRASLEPAPGRRGRVGAVVVDHAVELVGRVGEQVADGSARPSMARAGVRGGDLRREQQVRRIPTAAPTRVSSIRCQAADSAPSDPRPARASPLIATSTRLVRSRSTWPSVIETKISSPRLHHSSGTTVANTTASVTPATTATTRSSPLVSSDTGVTWTTSIAVSGASSGSVPGKNSSASDIAGRGGDRDPQRPQHGATALRAQPVQLARDPAPPPVGHGTHHPSWPVLQRPRRPNTPSAVRGVETRRESGGTHPAWPVVPGRARWPRVSQHAAPAM